MCTPMIKNEKWARAMAVVVVRQDPFRYCYASHNVHSKRIRELKLMKRVALMGLVSYLNI